MSQGRAASLKDASLAKEAITDVAFKFWQQTGQPHWHKVAGISMWPTLKRGDRVLVAPRAENLAVGDVVVVRIGKRVLVHRVVERSACGRVTTRGDFNTVPDPSVRIEQVVGRVVRVERNRYRSRIEDVRILLLYTYVRLRLISVPNGFSLRSYIRILKLLSKFTISLLAIFTSCTIGEENDWHEATTPCGRFVGRG